MRIRFYAAALTLLTMTTFDTAAQPTREEIERLRRRGYSEAAIRQLLERDKAYRRAEMDNDSHDPVDSGAFYREEHRRTSTYEYGPQKSLPPKDEKPEARAAREGEEKKVATILKELDSALKYKDNGSFEVKGDQSIITRERAMLNCIPNHSKQACEAALGEFIQLSRGDLRKQSELAQNADRDAALAKQRAEREARDKECREEYKQNPEAYVAKHNAKLIDAAKAFQAAALNFVAQAPALKDDQNTCSQQMEKLRKVHREFNEVREARSARCDVRESRLEDHDKLFKQNGLENISQLERAVTGAQGGYVTAEKVQTSKIKAIELGDMISKLSADRQLGRSCSREIQDTFDINRDKNSLVLKFGDKIPVYEMREKKQNCWGTWCSVVKEQVQIGTASDEVIGIEGDVEANRFKVTTVNGCQINQLTETEYVGRSGSKGDPDVLGKQQSEVRILVNDKGLRGIEKKVSKWATLKDVIRPSGDKNLPEGRVNVASSGCGEVQTVSAELAAGQRHFYESDLDFGRVMRVCQMSRTRECQRLQERLLRNDERMSDLFNRSGDGRSMR